MIAIDPIAIAAGVNPIQDVVIKLILRNEAVTRRLDSATRIAGSVAQFHRGVTVAINAVVSITVRRAIHNQTPHGGINADTMIGRHRAIFDRAVG